MYSKKLIAHLSKIAFAFALTFVFYGCTQEVVEVVPEDEVTPAIVFDEIYSELLKFNPTVVDGNLKYNDTFKREDFIATMDQVALKYNLKKERIEDAVASGRLECDEQSGTYFSRWFCVASYTLGCDFDIMCETCWGDFWKAVQTSRCVTIHH